MADDGFYMCRASNEVGEDIQVVHVMVKARPSRQHTAPSISAPSVVQANYYTPVNLTCTVTGYPVPNVTWTYKYQQNAIMAFGKALHILQATNATEGVYTCTATNDVGTSKADVTLKVVHGVPRITNPPKSSLNRAGIDGSFTCQADGVPKPTVTWTFQPFGQAGNTLGVRQGSQITITNMQQSGILTCIATNEFGTERAQANIIISKGGASVVG
ncbi:neural cell adhesion molecule L1-like protein [Mytilus californianus]|uniref:neural cell adhesion molecule L1-like protein n=1 Tax=Mytilus californianus TaxID=6549 RepID=UPI002245DF77|nr:neural cell adhesion molecule L1-like protein [Mytilus californianus]